MTINKFSAGIFVAVLIASFAPWEVKFVGVLIGYAVLLQRFSGTKAIALALSSTTYRLVLWFVIVMWFSAYFNHTSKVELAKASLVAAVVPLFVLITRLDATNRTAVLRALVAGSVVFTAYYAAGFEWNQLLNPEYRGDKDADVFVALNGAFIFAYAIKELLFPGATRRWTAGLAVLLAYGFLVVLIIKSRGTLSAMAITVGYLVVRYYKFSALRLALYALPPIGLVVLFASQRPDLVSTMVERISELFFLTDDGTRSFASGSGRFVAWDYALNVLWPESFWIGHGPRSNYELIESATMIVGAHNAIIASVVDGGLLGVIPVLALTLLPLWKFRHKVNHVFGYEYYFIFLAAVLNENLMFTYGSPFSWVALLAVCELVDRSTSDRQTLARRRRPPSTALYTSSRHA